MPNMPKIYEYRGVRGFWMAEVLTDDPTNGYSTGEVFVVAGVSNVTRNVEQSMDTHYYNNYGAVVVDSVPTDQTTIDASALPKDIYAKITGSYYDPYTGMLVEGKRQVKYWAFGYIGEDTDGGEYYSWHLKARVMVGGVAYTTKNNSTDAAGQTLTFMGVRTSTEFVKNGAGANSVEIDAGLGLVDVTSFFNTVQTPDTIVPKTTYELTITVGAGASNPVVKRNGVALADGDTIYAGDQLQISVVNGTVKVNNVAFTSGDIHVVTGNTTIAVTSA